MHDRVHVNGFIYDRRTYEQPHDGHELVHEILATDEDGTAVCACGLVVAPADDWLHVPGHVNPVTKLPADAIVFHVPQQSYYQVICRACTWSQIRPTLHLATACRRRHQCDAHGLHPGAIRLRTGGDFLAAALERTGWTVGADDPRANQFLLRTMELVREQDRGRINIDQLNEALRREFPLR